MVRTPIPKNTETNVLVKCRRRCCLCFGLDRDTSLKGGQIAHLDHDASNGSEDNLAFLCFDHHDEYDSRTSQRKGLTIGEVKTFRSELISSLNSVLSQTVHFGEMKTPPNDPYAGQYICIGTGDDSAEILLTPLPDTYEGAARYFVSGLSLWGASREYGPNIGTLEFVGTMDDPDTLIYTRKTYREGIDAETRFIFVEPGYLKVTEVNERGQYGANVTFEGMYRKAE